MNNLCTLMEIVERHGFSFHFVTNQDLESLAFSRWLGKDSRHGAFICSVLLLFSMYRL